MQALSLAGRRAAVPCIARKCAARSGWCGAVQRRTLALDASPLHESGSATGLGDGTCIFCKSIGPLALQALGTASPRQARGSHHSGGRSRAWGATSVNMAVAARELPSEGFHAIDGAVEPLHESHGQAGVSEWAWAAGGAGPGGPPRARRPGGAGPGGKIPIPGLLWPESPPQRACRGSRTGRPRSRRARRTRSPATPACDSALRVLR